MAAKRVSILWAILGVVGGMALGAWYMGSRIQSPAEMAARTAAPEPSAILVPVESRVLSSDVVTRGTVRFGLPQPISIAPSTVKGAVGLISSLPPRHLARAWTTSCAACALPRCRVTRNATCR